MPHSPFIFIDKITTVAYIEISQTGRAVSTIRQQKKQMCINAFMLYFFLLAQHKLSVCALCIMYNHNQNMQLDVN